MPNRMRWDGQTRKFYEVWYYIVQKPASGEGFWIRYTLLNPGDDHPAAGAGLWFGYAKRGDPGAGFAITRTLPATAFRCPPGELDIALGDATLTEGHLRGDLDADGHRVEWDLRYEGKSEMHHLFFGPLLRRIASPKTSVTVPNPRALFSGTVTVDGRRVELDGDPGHGAHHWGSEKAAGWRWAHCAAFAEAPEAIFEGLSSEKPPIPTLSFGRLTTAGEVLDFTSLSATFRNRFVVHPGRWQFSATGLTRRLEVELTADPTSLIRFVYHSPEYRVSTCYNSPVADAVARVYRRGSMFGSWELGLELHAEGTANAEVVIPAGADASYRRALGIP